MFGAVITGGLAGLAMGYVLQRGQICFHAMGSGVLSGRWFLARGWLLGVAVAAVGLSVVFLLPLGDGLNRGLAFRPVANIVGGLVIGAGMAIARSCVSGLFYKLGAGMLGAFVGLLAWVGGELVARQVAVPGPTVLGGGDEATLPGLMGAPRLVVALALLVAVLVLLGASRGRDQPAHRWQWSWPMLGAGLAVATVAGWILAELGGSSFGPSTVGASASVADGTPNWWLLAFLVGIVVGGFVAARAAGGFWARGETRVRYVQLAGGGFLLGAGGWIAGGCNLGHGVSGLAQLSVSSFVVVAAMLGGLSATQALVRALLRRPTVPVGDETPSGR